MNKIYVCMVLSLCLLMSVGFSITLAENQMTLLAVSELENGEKRGSVATLTLELIPGSGRVFLDTFPLTQADTQISTRIAKEIACDFTNVSCDQYDFIYTISSGSSIIGGPSAGAAISAITVLTLEGERIRPNVAITGTSNTGGLIGPVGGLKEKIEAAARNGISTVIIPKTGRAIPQPVVPSLDYVQNETSNPDNYTENTTEIIMDIDLVLYGLSLGVSVIEVGNLYEVLTQSSFRTYDMLEQEVEIPRFYRETMSNLATRLCERTEDAISALTLKNFPALYNGTNASISIEGLEVSPHFEGPVFIPDTRVNILRYIENVEDLQNNALEAMTRGDYYSAASFCYNSGINIRFLSFLPYNFTDIADDVQQAVTRVEQIDLSGYTTIIELQTFMLVTERIHDAREHFEQAIDLYSQNRTIDAKFELAQAKERAFSAESWSAFFLRYGKEFIFDTAILQESCTLKIQEAQARQNYVALFSPFLSSSDILDMAKEYRQNQQFELCLFEASKAKARFDVILGSMGANSDEDIQQLITEREHLVRQTIAKQNQREVFPIIGFSYFEYALSLRERDPSSSLLYMQLALELSNLDVYFPSQRLERLRQSQPTIQLTQTQIIYLSFVAGLLLAILLNRIEMKLRHVSYKKPAQAKRHTSSHPSRKKR
ncbi:MAG: S16 family serine protease [Candidatus Woesearchaeota archaeon]